MTVSRTMHADSRVATAFGDIGNMMDATRQVEIEAAVFRRLLAHLDVRKDVQNIDLMNLAGFCRNCLAKWYVQAADEQGESVADSAARERVYGMPYAEWKALYQREASAAQLTAFEQTQAEPAHK